MEIATADAIVTMAHGLLADWMPSPGDRILADMVRKLNKQFPGKPIIPQEPVARAAPEIQYVTVARPPKGNALGSSNMSWNTRVVAESDAYVCRNNGWKKVAFVATPYNQPRTQWELKRCGLKAIAVSVLPFSMKYNRPASIYWCGRGGVWRYLLVEATRGRAHYLSY